jgi:hypothetical protein
LADRFDRCHAVDGLRALRPPLVGGILSLSPTAFGQMKLYCAYETSPLFAGAIPINRTDLHCASEEEAKEQAKALVGLNTIELWEGARLIARFDPPLGDKN